MWGGTDTHDIDIHQYLFQSTHPVWGGTFGASLFRLDTIHFNPPTPCGVGLYQPLLQNRYKKFQSTHPVWGGTGSALSGCTRGVISIHPPRVGWDEHAAIRYYRSGDFNPPTPCGVGRVRAFQIFIVFPFQSTHPVWGGTNGNPLDCTRVINFNPPTPCGVGL